MILTEVTRIATLLSQKSFIPLATDLNKKYKKVNRTDPFH